MSLLAFDHFSIDYGGTAAVRDVTFAVARGEIVALVGESGSGKSSIALAALDLLPAGARTRGSVRIDARPFAPADRGSRIALIFQDPASALNPALTIGRQIGETIAPSGDRPSRVAALLAQVGLDVPPSRYPHELSGGQRQRVAIAIALAGDPALIIADEPTAALDPASRATIAALLETLVRERGIGLLLITHDLALAARLATRIVVLDHGALVEEGAAGDRLAAPTSPALRALVAASTPRAGPPPLPPSADGQLLIVDHVSRRYRAGWRGAGTVALDDVSFGIAAGETLGLIGASGAGKSTLARIALGLERPDEGAVEIGGLSPFATRADERRAVRRLAQAVFQDPATSFDPRHTVGRIVAEPLRLADRPIDPSARVAAALAKVGLDPAIAERAPSSLSGGQRQRVALARALILGPRLVVLDEALSALDLRIRAEMIDLLAGLRADLGIAYLLISHDLDVVTALAHRVIELRDGRIVG